MDLAKSKATERLPSDRPNLIVVMVDDMGYAGVSCFGNPYFKTPEIDRLAAEGMRLTDFHSSGTVCSPTRAGLLTGRYQQRAGIEAVIHPASDHPEHRKGLQPSETTFAEVLQEAGYATGLIGKWHQGYPQNSDDYHPQNHGFDEFVGYHSGNIDFVSHVGDHDRHDWWHGRKETHEEGYYDAPDQSLRRRLRSPARKAEKPFCLYIAHEAIHNPVQVPGDPVRRTEQAGWDVGNWRKEPEERIEKYKGMTLPIDEGVGQIAPDADRIGNLDRTRSCCSSPTTVRPATFPAAARNSAAAKEPFTKAGTRVPAIAWWPGGSEPGTSLTSPADQHRRDADAAGAGRQSPRRRTPAWTASIFRRCCSSRSRSARRPLFWASLSNNGSRSEAMREGPWKLVVLHPKAAKGTFENEQLELYRLDRRSRRTERPGERASESGGCDARTTEGLVCRYATFRDASAGRLAGVRLAGQ